MNKQRHPAVLSTGQSQPSYPALALERFATAATLHAKMHRHFVALRKRWWVLVLTFLLVASPAVYYAAVKPPVFHSMATMWLTSKLIPSAEQTRFSDELSTSYEATQAELIKSKAIQLPAFQRVRSAFPEIAALDTNAQSEWIPISLMVSIPPKSSVLDLEARGRFPEATRAFLNAVMDEYLDLKKVARQQTSAGALSGITDQIKEAERKIQRQQETLTAFRESNNISYLTEHGQSAGIHLAKLVENISDLRTEHQLLESLTPEEFRDLARGSAIPYSDIPLPGEKAAHALGAEGARSDTAITRPCSNWKS